MNRKFCVSSFLLFCLVPTIVFAETNTFARSLSFGARGDDVKLLQKFLNTSPETLIAETGAGSPGNETGYFGSATKRALVKFQEKYHAEVLAPVGLSSGTGVFGEKTRAKINALLGTAPVPASVFPRVYEVAPASKAPTTVTSSAEKGKVVLMFPSQYSGAPGTMITLSGSGFTSTDNTVCFSDKHTVIKANSQNGQNITFKVPNIPTGIYSLFIKNARGVSDKGPWFVVTDGITPKPKIDSVTPEHVVRGDTVVIKGSGFTSAGNIIQYGGGVIMNIPSKDGESLSFSLPVDLFMSATSSFAKKVTLPLWITVVNENGVSNQKSYILEF